MTDNVFDIHTRKPVKPDMPKDATVAQWLNAFKKYIKDNGAESILIVGIDREGTSFYDVIGVSEIDLLRLYRELDKVKLLIDDKLDPEEEEYEIEFE